MLPYYSRDFAPPRRPVGEPNTDALVVRAQRGDPAALERLVERYLGALTGFCRRLAHHSAGVDGGEGGAQDLVQETLLRAVISLSRLEDPERFEAWLFGIAANVARKRWRQAQRSPVSLDAALPHPDAEWTGVRPLWEAPESDLDLAERSLQLERAMSRLPQSMGRVLTLHYADGLSYAEIAARLGVPVSTVKGRLFKSRHRLRLALGISQPTRIYVPPPQRMAPHTPKKGTTMQVQTQSHDPERLIASAQERVTRAAEFYRQWFGRENGVGGLGESARETFRQAARESQSHWHNYLGTEHLLLGLLTDEQGAPAAALTESGVRLDEARAIVQRRIGRGKEQPESPIGLVPRVKTVVDLSVAEARRLGASEVGAEHLLLGLLREGSGVAALVIEELGADLYDVRDRLLARIRPAKAGALRPQP